MWPSHMEWWGLRGRQKLCQLLTAVWVRHDSGGGGYGGIGLALILRDNVDAAKLGGMVGSEGQAEAMPTPTAEQVRCKCGWGMSAGRT
jgi:hypothetical protein